MAHASLNKRFNNVLFNTISIGIEGCWQKQLESYSLNIRKDFKNVGLKKVQVRGKMHTRMLWISRNVYQVDWSRLRRMFMISSMSV